MSAIKGDPKRFMPVENLSLHFPNLSELSDVIQAGLKENFKEAFCSVTNCPNLTEKPFCLAAPGKFCYWSTSTCGMVCGLKLSSW